MPDFPNPTAPDTTAEGEEELARLLFEAREQLDMWADVVAARTGARDRYVDGLRNRLDDYRERHGLRDPRFSDD